MRVCLAGFEKMDYVLKHKPKNVLVSYLYLKDDREKLKLLKESVEFIILDSGAASIIGAELSGTKDSKKATIKQGSEKIKEQFGGNYDNYFENYKKFVSENLDVLSAVVELDIIDVVGEEKAMRWRDEMYAIAKEKMIAVYHGNKEENFEEMCKKYPYVGIVHSSSKGTNQSLFNIAKKHKTKIHGFAMTKEQEMRMYPYYSVDSTSWLAGARFGATFYFRQNKLEAYGKDEKEKMRKFLKPKVESAKIDYDKFIKDEIKEVNEWNALQWITFGEYIDKHSKKYWSETGSTKGTDNLPKEYRGKIHLICRDNPEIEMKRKIRLKNAMSGNMFNFKNGQYLNPTRQMYCNNCYVAENCPLYQEPQEGQKIMCGFNTIFDKVLDADKLDMRDEETVMNTVNKLATVLAQKISRGVMFEQLDGGLQDKTLAGQIAILSEILNSGRKAMVNNNFIQNNYYGLATDAREQLDERQQKLLADAIQTIAVNGEERPTRVSILPKISAV